MPVSRRPASAAAGPSGISIPRWFLTEFNGRQGVQPTLLAHLRAFYQQLDHAEGDREEDPCPIMPDVEDEDAVHSEEDGEPMSASDDEDEPVPSTSAAAQAMQQAAPQTFQQPGPCSFLSPGQTFTGRQQMAEGASEDDWKVTVRIEGYDHARGYVCGVMEAHNVPSAKGPVVTFWEGEVVDNVSHSFRTSNMESSMETDMKHWALFAGFRGLGQEVVLHGGRCSALASSPHVYMRWKERCFVDTQGDCGLSIAGFYYVCICRRDGSIQGYYYDLSSMPFQQLRLQPEMQGAHGHAFGSYKFC